MLGGHLLVFKKRDSLGRVFSWYNFPSSFSHLPACTPTQSNCSPFSKLLLHLQMVWWTLWCLQGKSPLFELLMRIPLSPLCSSSYILCELAPGHVRTGMFNPCHPRTMPLAHNSALAMFFLELQDPEEWWCLSRSCSCQGDYAGLVQEILTLVRM